MRVLVVEDTVGSSIDVVLDLVEAGHQVVRCQPVGAELTPCVGLAAAGPCPLAEPADAAVQVHDGEADLTMRELGVVCAGRLGLPIVNVGTAPSRVASIVTTPAELAGTLARIGRAASRATPRGRP